MYSRLAPLRMAVLSPRDLAHRPFLTLAVVTHLFQSRCEFPGSRKQGTRYFTAEAADPGRLPPVLKPFKVVAPFITDINLSLDDRFLYVSCWGTGDFKQYDVSDPYNPKLTGNIRLGGIVSHAEHPKGGVLNGAPQMVEVSRDGKRIYFSNSLYGAWDAQYYPAGVKGWIAKVDAHPSGGMTLDKDFFVEFDGNRPYQIRLEGGDAPPIPTAIHKPRLTPLGDLYSIGMVAGSV